MLLKWIYHVRHFCWVFWHVLQYVYKPPLGRVEIQTISNQLNSNNLIIDIWACIFFLFQLVRVLVSPDNPQQATATCQKILNQCGECHSTAYLKWPSIGKMLKHNANLLYSYCKSDEQILSYNLSCTVRTYCILVWIIESCNMDEKQLCQLYCQYLLHIGLDNWVL